MCPVCMGWTWKSPHVYSMHACVLFVAYRQGQFGVAWKARHKQDGQLYCVKKIPLQNKVSCCCAWAALPACLCSS